MKILITQISQRKIFCLRNKAQKVVQLQMNPLWLFMFVFTLVLLLLDAISLAIAMHLNLKCFSQLLDGFSFNALDENENILVSQSPTNHLNCFLDFPSVFIRILHNLCVCSSIPPTSARLPFKCSR